MKANVSDKIISLNVFRAMKQAEKDQYEYHARILGMEKHELLNEMIRFQEDRSKAGKLSPEMIVKGKILFAALEKSAETDALKSLSTSYRRHLELEYQSYLEKKRG